MTKPTIKLVATHRIDPEKGRDLIINWLRKILPDQNFPYRIEYDIYGDGKMKEDIVALAKAYPDNVRYHGFVSVYTIFASTMDYDFVMMPSRFLETFGLSALDFAQFGIPTIGYKKGGVVPFILDNLNISAYPGHTEQEQFDNAMHEICSKKSNAAKDTASDYSIDKDSIVSLYSQSHWLEQFRELVS